ncbi:MAG: BamA/TamA family outer membrane protein [Gracilimonas sp.]|nr:BamA/TamA family outer membrane protein [Gracilimonas sp.]
MLKSVYILLVLMLPVSALAQGAEGSLDVYEVGEKVSLPDSVKDQLRNRSLSGEEILLRWLSDEGYLNASVTIRNDSLRIDRGCLYELKTLTVIYSGELNEQEINRPEAAYSRAKLYSELDAILFNLNERGYPFAEAQISDFRTNNDHCSVDIVFNVDIGRKAEASEIIFLGSENNSQEFLTKVSGFEANELITPQYLRYLRSNLLSSELFNDVSAGSIMLKESNPVVVFEVQDRSLNRFDGLLGYVPDAAGNGQIVGDLELSLWNVLSEGNGLHFQYQRLRPETSELDVGVSQDWIGEIPIGLSGGFQFYQNDTTYQSRQFDLGGYYRVSGGMKVTGGIEFQSSISGSNIPTIVEPDGSKRTARLGFEYSNLDRFDVPTSGNSLSVSYGIANKDLEDDSTGTFNQNSLELKAHQYFSVFERSVIALSMQGFLLEADRITFNDLIRFGGANSFRGYAEDQFQAGRLFWGDMEYQFLLDRQSYLFVFGAYGAYHRPKLLTETTSDFRTTKYLYSTGFGLSYQTRIGRLKFTYAVSPEESFANGKVHFGIRTEL